MVSDGNGLFIYDIKKKMLLHSKCISTFDVLELLSTEKPLAFRNLSF